MSDCPGLVSYAHGVDHCPGCEEAAPLLAALANVSGALADAHDVPVPDDHLFGAAVRGVTAERNQLRAQLAEAVPLVPRLRALMEEWERQNVVRWGVREGWAGDPGATVLFKIRALLADLPDAPVKGEL